MIARITCVGSRFECRINRSGRTAGLQISHLPEAVRREWLATVRLGQYVEVRRQANNPYLLLVAE